jgi:hypothetical protein
MEIRGFGLSYFTSQLEHSNVNVPTLGRRVHLIELIVCEFWFMAKKEQKQIASERWRGVLQRTCL